MASASDSFKRILVLITGFYVNFVYIYEGWLKGVNLTTTHSQYTINFLSPLRCTYFLQWCCSACIPVELLLVKKPLAFGLWLEVIDPALIHSQKSFHEIVWISSALRAPPCDPIYSRPAIVHLFSMESTLSTIFNFHLFTRCMRRPKVHVVAISCNSLWIDSYPALWKVLFSMTPYLIKHYFGAWSGGDDQRCHVYLNVEWVE